MPSTYDMFEGGRSSRPFTAKFPGICETCQEGFEKGDEVMYEGSDLVHASPDDCEAVSVSRSSRSAKSCSKCFLVHAGECF